jgi:hypothetical protein
MCARSKSFLWWWCVREQSRTMALIGFFFWVYFVCARCPDVATIIFKKLGKQTCLF